jgi:hypothetical protein
MNLALAVFAAILLVAAAMAALAVAGYRAGQAALRRKRAKL